MNGGSTASSGPPPWVWFVGCGCGLPVLGCILAVIVFLFVAAQGPETDVYSGNEVPRGYLETMQEVGALEPGENVRYFYSDAFGGIDDSFYFVSDSRVVLYREETVTAVPFAEIADLRLDREESFFFDSQVTLEVQDGRIVSFPLSSEQNGDVRFFEFIRERVEVEDSGP